MTQQATANLAQGNAPPWGLQGAVTQAPPQSSWQEYYTYAEQLHAAGHLEQAEAYYRQAQTLRNQAENQWGNQSLALNDTSSYAQPQSNLATAQSPAVYVDHSLVTEAAPRIPAKRTKRPLLRRIMVWAASSLVMALLVSISGFVALFYFYKDQRIQGTTDAPPPSSVLGCVQHVTFNPMVATLQPVFDKTIRLS